jgi:hypothetical protein
MEKLQTAVPEGFNNADWQLHKGNKDHVRFLPKCVALFWMIWEGQQLTGEAFFQQEWAAKKLGITVRHLQNLIAELKLAGLILIDRRDQNYYKVVEFFSRPVQEWVEVAKQKVKAVLDSFFGAFAKQQAKPSEQGQSARSRKQTQAEKDKAKAQVIAKAALEAQATASQEVEAEPTEEQLKEEAIKRQEAFAKLEARANAEYEARVLIKRLNHRELYEMIVEIANKVITPYASKPSKTLVQRDIGDKLYKIGFTINKVQELGSWIAEIAENTINRRFGSASAGN